MDPSPLLHSLVTWPSLSLSSRTTHCRNLVTFYCAAWPSQIASQESQRSQCLSRGDFSFKEPSGRVCTKSWYFTCITHPMCLQSGCRLPTLLLSALIAITLCQDHWYIVLMPQLKVLCVVSITHQCFVLKLKLLLRWEKLLSNRRNLKVII